MYRKIKHTVLITMMLCVSLVSQAYDFKDGDCYYTITSLSEQTVALTNSGEIVSSDGWHTRYAACYGGDFVVPQTAEYLGKIFKVTSIDEKAFQDCNLDKLTIPSTVISASIRGVIQNLIIEDSDTPLSELRTYSVKEVYVGRDIDVPGNHLVYCFSNSSIEKIVFAGSATYVPGGILEECGELVNVELSSSIKAILNGAFYGCTKLKTISGSSVELIEDRAFCNCTSLESFDFPNLKTIDNGDWGTYRWGVFQGCTSLKSVILPQGLASIGTMAFMDCTSLESITIPASIVFIGDKYNIEHSSVFTNCPLLKNITINGLEPIAIDETTFDAQTYINATLKIPVGTKDKYMAARNWKNFFTMEEDANINDGIFSVIFNGCSNYSGGYVEANGKEITNDNSAITARKGESITLKFISNSNEYNNNELESVKVNGVDVTRNVVGNELVIEVTGNMTVDISWTETEEAPVFLSIKQADNGNVKLKVSKWDEYKVIFEPAEGWKIHSVTFNGTDVTNELSSDNSYRTPEITENSELIVVYASSTNAIDGIRSEQPSPKVVGSSGCIVISEAEEGQTVYAYTTAGVLVDTAVTHNGTTTIRVQENEVYIVKVGNKTFKVGM